MPVDPLDPSRPVLADPVQITEELRAIKSRLVADLAAIESLQSIIVSITDPGVFGLSFLGTETVTDAHILMGVGATGLDIYQSADVDDVRTLLNIVSPNPTINAGSGKTTISFPGGLKINTITGDFVDESTHFFNIPFTTVLFGVSATLLQNTNDDFQVYSENITGFSVSFEGTGVRRGSVIAIGI